MVVYKTTVHETKFLTSFNINFSDSFKLSSGCGTLEFFFIFLFFFTSKMLQKTSSREQHRFPFEENNRMKSNVYGFQLNLCIYVFCARVRIKTMKTESHGDQYYYSTHRTNDYDMLTFDVHIVDLILLIVIIFTSIKFIY